MFGASSMGDLVIATGDSHPDNEVFRESGNLGNQWNQGIVDFTGALWNACFWSNFHQVRMFLE